MWTTSVFLSLLYTPADAVCAVCSKRARCSATRCHEAADPVEGALGVGSVWLFTDILPHGWLGSTREEGLVSTGDGVEDTVLDFPGPLAFDRRTVGWYAPSSESPNGLHDLANLVSLCPDECAIHRHPVAWDHQSVLAQRLEHSVKGCWPLEGP